MMPPTPTPIPAGTPVNLNLEGSELWSMAPDMVGLWGQFGDYTQALQWGLIVLLLLVLMWHIASLIRGLSEEEA
jgi:hypothetical protein